MCMYNINDTIKIYTIHVHTQYVLCTFFPCVIYIVYLCLTVYYCLSLLVEVERSPLSLSGGHY